MSALDKWLQGFQWTINPVLHDCAVSSIIGTKREAYFNTPPLIPWGMGHNLPWAEFSRGEATSYCPNKCLVTCFLVSISRSSSFWRLQNLIFTRVLFSIKFVPTSCGGFHPIANHRLQWISSHPGTQSHHFLEGWLQFAKLRILWSYWLFLWPCRVGIDGIRHPNVFLFISANRELEALIVSRDTWCNQGCDNHSSPYLGRACSQSFPILMETSFTWGNLLLNLPQWVAGFMLGGWALSVAKNGWLIILIPPNESSILVDPGSVQLMQKCDSNTSFHMLHSTANDNIDWAEIPG